MTSPRFPARLRRLTAASLLAIAAAVPASAESLGDAMVAAYRHAALLDQNRAVLRAADEDVATALSALRPVLSWSLAHQYQSEEGLDATAQTLQLQAEMLIYDFGRSQYAIDAAKELVLATRAQLVSVEQQVLLEAVQAYLNVRSSRQQVTLNENSVRVLTEEERAANDRYEVGEITVTDVSLAEAQLAETRAGLATAQGNLQTAIEAYQTATGRAPGDLSAPPSLPQLPKSLEAARAIAQRTHPGIEAGQRNVAAAEIQVAAAAADRRPTITGSVGVTGTRTGGPASRQASAQGGSSDRTSGESAAAIQMQQTLYAGGRLSSAHRKQMAARDQARAQLLQTSREVAQAVGVAWSNIDVARAQIVAIDEQISAAQQAYDGVREEATLGARTTLDVLDSEQDLLTARANKITAEANLQLAHYQLLSSMGLLTVENLKLGIPTYDPSAYYNAVRDAPYTSEQGKSLDRVLRAIGKSQ